jgi:alkylhydroperoxidase family enzyme
MSRKERQSFDLKAREAEILGRPPRIAPLGADEIGEDVRAVVAEVVRSVSRTPPKTISAYVAIMVRHIELYRRHMALALQLFSGALTPRYRELAILRLAWLCQAPFEWGEHVDVGKRIAGLTAADVERVTQGSRVPGWKEDDRAILSAVEELMEDAMISDETWATLERYLDAKQLLELPILIGQYQSVAYLQNSIRCPLLPGNAGLAAR